MLHEYIVIGSGPAGTAAAMQLAGRNVLMLDAGLTPQSVPNHYSGNLFTLRESGTDLFGLFTGEDYRSLCNIFDLEQTNLKLKAPYNRFITDQSTELSPVSATNFGGCISLAKGGLANAWGAGAYRFTDEDLRDFPVSYAELAPHYDRLTEHMGISGTNDELSRWFLEDSRLLPPIRLGPLASDLLERYQRRKAEFNRSGFHMGRTRLAVLTQEHEGRRPYAYDHMEFYRPHGEAIYTPAFTLDRLIQEQAIEYQAGWVAQRFEEGNGQITVAARHMETGEIRNFAGRKLLIAAGAINTARIALQSTNDNSARLPILDNLMSAFPVFRPDRVGKALCQHEPAVAQLNIIHEAQGQPTVQGSFYTTNAPLRSDILFNFPLAASVSRDLLNLTASATALTMLFYPGIQRAQNFVRLTPSASLEIHFEKEIPDGQVERSLLTLLRKSGYWSHPALIEYLKMGTSLHYAGMLPMKANPTHYECDPNGKLFGTEGVFIMDGAGFPALPAKNLTLTIMANACRIASKL